MSYADALLRIDVRNENIRKDQAMEAARQAREEELANKGLFGMIGMGIGFLLGGTPGAYLGKHIMESGYELFDDEGEYIPDIDVKFQRHEWEQQIQSLKDYDKDTDVGSTQWLTNIGKDLFKAYIGSGGYVQGEGFQNPFELDWFDSPIGLFESQP